MEIKNINKKKKKKENNDNNDNKRIFELDKHLNYLRVESASDLLIVYLNIIKSSPSYSISEFAEVAPTCFV